MAMSRPVDEARGAVIGAGAWGTTLAWLIAGRGHPVCLWARDPARAAAMQAERQNHLRLPGTVFPELLSATGDLAEALAGASFAVFAVPSEHLRRVARLAGRHVAAGTLLISATKGLEIGSGKCMTEILVEETGLEPGQVMALSGPNLSGEIAAGAPAVSVIAGTTEDCVLAAQAFLSTPLFRVYANYDILGVQVCGALKNVIAIAAGVCDGLGYGANAKAALVTRGLAEIGRLGTRLGAQRATFWGVAGVGDLLATCNSSLSRNWQVGQSLAAGQAVVTPGSPADPVAEGIPTTVATRELALRVGVEVPITQALYEVLFEGRRPSDAVHELMTRRWRAELEDWQ